MKKLCTTKKYDLSQLNDEQLQTVLDWLKDNDTGWDAYNIENLKLKPYLSYDFNQWSQYLGNNATNALELFEEEPNGYEIVVNNMGRVEPKYPNYSFDKSDVYQRADKLMQDGKQQGLKIVVTFEAL